MSGGRKAVAAVLGAASLLALGVVLLGSATTGALAPFQPIEFDPGALVRYGLPVARVVHDGAAAVTVGLLVVAAWCVGPDRFVARAARERGALVGTRLWMTRAAAVAGAVWLAAAVVVLVFTVSDVSSVHVGTPGYGTVLVSFLTQVDLGRSLLASALLVAAAAVAAATVTRAFGVK